MYEDIFEELKDHAQLHVLRWWNELDEEARARLAEQVRRIDWEMLLKAQAQPVRERGRIQPVDGLSLREIAARREEFFACGKRELRAGKLALVLLAGGQGTRLGSEMPKGTVDIGITRPLYIFEQLIRNLQDVVRQCGAYVPLYVMTSAGNDAATRAFFEEHAYFGYPAGEVHFFRQSLAPAVGFDGKLLMSAKDSLALSPNGNGGWYASLVHAGLAEALQSRGVEWFNVFSVDNVLQRMADPVFLGATVLSGRACGAKFVRKAYPEERVGALCLEDGLPSVIEYYELDKEMANLRDEQGELVYGCGVTLNYLFRADVVRNVAESSLPIHVARKKVPFLNDAGELVEPQTENACKFETLILDMVRCAGSCLPFEIDREKEFAPIKNRTGQDSVETARVLLAKNGVEL